MPATIKAPCRADAKRAAEALVAAGVSRVVLFGSVARGGATELSDIDLVAIYDDLDYGERRERKAELTELLGYVVGHPADVLVTDRPEWKVRTEQVLTSFENRVAGEGVVLADQGIGTVNWGKEMVLPTSGYAEAVRRLREVSKALTTLNMFLKPNEEELEERNFGDPDEALYMFVVRLENACGQVQRIVESAVKTLVHVAGRRRNLRGHDINELCGLLIDPYLSGVRARVDEDTAEEITRWHELSRYEPDETMREPATPELVQRLARMACSVASYTIDQLDDPGPYAPRIRRAADTVARRIGSYDLETGSPLATGSRRDDDRPDRYPA